jgi:hypothetical protein
MAAGWGCVAQYFILCSIQPFLGLLFFAAVSKVHRKGSVNYKNKILIQLISKILPNGEYGWQAVAMAYQERTKEEALHDCIDVKKH